MSDNPGQYSIVPTQALWGWSAPVVGQAPVALTYPPYGAPTKSGVLPSDLADFIGVPLQLWTNPPTPINPKTILGWIRYAEDEIETVTNVRLCQTWIAAPPTKTSTQTQVVGLGVQESFQNLGVDYDYSEAAYDFFYERARDAAWLYQRLRWRPVKGVEVFSLANADPGNLTGVKNWSFVYPLLSQFFRMPTSWLVEDQNRGLIRAVPAVDVAMLPLFAMQLAFMGFAESVPGALWFQYTAGLTANDYNSSWSFMKQLVLAKAAIRALRGMQLSVNAGAVETQTTADGLAYRVKYSDKGAFSGQIKEMQQEADMLMKRARMMGGGVALGIL